ncbi:peptidylprolyl isomerase [Thiohalomonas denitrificans]|uniref:Peptidyl-prolyl cis-trans isomerase n=1 Tax=Thiohalomonas denitrificans TaxID=415747 RepID=A0A1G5QPC5_9GAMM|nr:peptidylprolyl isomerase [Thiohalomonas denitrificans]SCZ63695.1 peptidyl-prolyl cis-trans isomerase B (cyclophilin B) [Thiohalomonas denitrificans]
MKRLLTGLLLCAFLSTASAAADTQSRVEMETSKGKIVLELYPEKAPETVENFLRYAEDGFFDGTIFHRVIQGFMIQGGGFTPDMQRKPTRAPVVNEADNGLSNETGTIAMARTSDPHSATSQFFINVSDNRPLDFTGRTPRGWGYTVFGRVVEGMDVVKQIENSATTIRNGHRDVPEDNVIIEKVSRINHASQ